MARSSFHELARILGRNIGNTTPTREPYLSNLEGGLQSIGLGLEKTVVEIIDDRTRKKGLLYLFRWQTDTIHFFNASHYRGSLPGEVIQAKADAAMDVFILKELETKIPNIDDFMKFKKI